MSGKGSSNRNRIEPLQTYRWPLSRESEYTQCTTRTSDTTLHIKVNRGGVPRYRTGPRAHLVDLAAVAAERAARPHERAEPRELTTAQPTDRLGWPARHPIASATATFVSVVHMSLLQVSSDPRNAVDMWTIHPNARIAFSTARCMNTVSRGGWKLYRCIDSRKKHGRHP